MIVIQIEELAAIEQLDALLKLEQPDVFFIGPTDLASSMGLRGDKGDPRVTELVAETLHRIVAAGRTPGILASTPAEVAEFLALGARYLVLNGESLVVWGARLALGALEAGCGRVIRGGIIGAGDRHLPGLDQARCPAPGPVVGSMGGAGDRG